MDGQAVGQTLPSTDSWVWAHSSAVLCKLRICDGGGVRERVQLRAVDREPLSG